MGAPGWASQYAAAMVSDEAVPGRRPDWAQVRSNRASVRQACAALEGAIAEVSRHEPQRWAKGVEEAAGSVERAFARHVAANEADDGLLAEIVAVSPRLAHQAEQLRRDHRAIQAEIDDVVARTRIVGEPGTVDAVRSRSLDLLRHISEHRHMGVELVHEAYLVDIEAAD